MDDPNAIRNVPEDFDHFVGAPPRRLFAIFDDPASGQEVVTQLRSGRGLGGEQDVWVFAGEEGVRRLDLTGAGHGLHGEAVRFVQRLMSADMEYLRTLDRALRDGHMVVAVAVSHDDTDRVAGVLRAGGGHSLARVAHWNYVPVRP